MTLVSQPWRTGWSVTSIVIHVYVASLCQVFCLQLGQGSSPLKTKTGKHESVEASGDRAAARLTKQNNKICKHYSVIW